MFYVFVLFLVSVPSLTSVGTAEAFSREEWHSAIRYFVFKIFPFLANSRADNLEVEKALENELFAFAEEANRDATNDVDYEDIAVPDIRDGSDGTNKTKSPDKILANLLGGKDKINQPKN